MSSIGTLQQKGDVQLKAANVLFENLRKLLAVFFLLSSPHCDHILGGTTRDSEGLKFSSKRLDATETKRKTVLNIKGLAWASKSVSRLETRKEEQEFISLFRAPLGHFLTSLKF